MPVLRREFEALRPADVPAGPPLHPRVAGAARRPPTRRPRPRGGDVRMSVHATRSLVVVTAGLSEPSSTRLLADRLAAAVERHLREAGSSRASRSSSCASTPMDLANQMLTGFPTRRSRRRSTLSSRRTGSSRSRRSSAARTAGCSSCSSTSSIATASRQARAIAATGGTPRHSLALDHAMRPLFAYLGGRRRRPASTRRPRTGARAGRRRTAASSSGSSGPPRSSPRRWRARPASRRATSSPIRCPSRTSCAGAPRRDRCDGRARYARGYR